MDKYLEIVRKIKIEIENERILFKIKSKSNYLFKHRFTMSKDEILRFLEELEDCISFLQLNYL